MISIIVPTLGEREDEIIRLFKSLDEQLYKNFEVIVVSQNNHELINNLLNNVTFKYKHIKLHKKGLSYARNVALNYVKGNVITFSDDDCWYPPKALKTVNETLLLKNKEIVCYQIYDSINDKYYKNYPQNIIESLARHKLLNISSIEIFINLNKVRKYNIKFDELFGLGAKYPSGEENILLNDLYKMGYKISYYPEKIVFHLTRNNKNKLDGDMIISKGPLFKRIYNYPISMIMITVFFLKKFFIIRKPITNYLKAIIELNKYSKNYKKSRCDL